MSKPSNLPYSLHLRADQRHFPFFGTKLRPCVGSNLRRALSFVPVLCLISGRPAAGTRLELTASDGTTPGRPWPSLAVPAPSYEQLPLMQQVQDFALL